MKQAYATPSIRTLASQQIVDALGHASANYGDATGGLGD